MAQTPKSEFWSEVALPPVAGLVPGIYTLPTITISDKGLITDISSGGVALPVVNTVADLASVPDPFPGMSVVVVNNGNNKPAIYTYTTVPVADFVETASATHLNMLSVSFDSTASFPLLIAELKATTILKRVSLSVNTPFTTGTTFAVNDSNSTTWLPADRINAKAPNTFDIDLAGNDTPLGAGSHLYLILTGQIPVTGSGVVCIEYV